MASNKRLGIHWGETGFSFVEVSRETPTLTAFVPFPEPRASAQGSSLSQDISLLDTLQRTVRNKGFSATETYLSLPSKDILIRWFIIPWMKTSEIQSVVSFEAKKYIPFDLEEISYTYSPTTVTKDGIRQIGILFVAIRKSVLDKYMNVLLQAGLNIVYSEPGAMSIVRALMFKRQISPEQVTAILRTAGDVGELIIVSKGQVKFIRDFKIHSLDPLMPAAVSLPEQDMEEVLRARIFNEVRISFEFFSRQYSEEGVNKIIVLSSGLKQSFWTGLNEEFSVDMEIIDPVQSIVDGEGMNEGGINAFGVAIAGKVSAVIDFNLSEKASQSVSLKQEEVLKKNRQLILPVIVGVACAAMIAIIFFVSGFLINGVKVDVEAAMQRVGSRVDLTVDELSTKASDQKKELQALKSLPLKSRSMPLVVRLVKQLPKGIWLGSVEVSFKDKVGGGANDQKTSGTNAEGQADPVYDRVSTYAAMTISGYIHLKDSNAELGLANQFINVLRKDEEFSKLFKSIKLLSLKSDIYAKIKVTAFKISCEAQ
jgi:Tfp pilus assembly PilM family ATPase